MKQFIALVTALALFGPGDGKRSGRAGNAHYEAERYEQAESAFREGIVAARDAGVDPVHAGLLNNLGAALYRQGDFENAAASFAGGIRMSPGAEGIVRGSYNAGNASFRNEDLETALEYYRTTLLNDPSDQDAKFNYEFVKRRLQEQQEQEKQQDQQQNKDQQSDDQQQKGPNQTQNPDQDQQKEQNRQQQQGDQQQQGQDDQQQQEQEQQQRPTNPEELSQAEAQRILQALENEEQQLLRQVQKMDARPRRVEKDW
jgi:tetratricopeptide (TPR) repeat protein